MLEAVSDKDAEMMDTGVRVTDEEFMRLIGTTTLTFAAQMRAEAIAYDLRNRMAQVAADLRNAVDSGQATTPRFTVRIAREFERIARRPYAGGANTVAWTSFPKREGKMVSLAR